MTSSGGITHQYFDAPSLDQVFADQTTVSGILWPVEDQSGTVRDVGNLFLSLLPRSVCESSHV
jgi:hypothetical protein